MILLTLSTMLAATVAMPRYIAVPSDQIAFVDLTSLHLRVPRQTLEPPPPPTPQLPQALYNDYQAAYQPQRQLNLEEYQAIPVQQYVPQPLALAPAPQPAPARIVQEASEAPQYESRPPDFGEYVDFGAHTGDNGAFGWYADYPISNQHDSYRK